MMPDKYEVVIGLEVHVQLLTESKLFSGDSASFGAEPNTQISPITLGHPGTLPRLNRKAVEYAVRMGLACHSQIEKHNYFARKHYFYPDLPKGYQITQHEPPLCSGGYVKIHTSSGDKLVRITRIHLEEDAGKSLHDQDGLDSCIDYNRAGVPLIEIVSEPDIRSGEEAAAFLSELRLMVRYLGICDGNMEEGSMRCDANVSVRLIGEDKLGTKVEVKNMNSIRNVKRAIESEFARQVGVLDNGRMVSQETRSFDQQDGSSFAIRVKEMANDYRYFPEPDLAPFQLTEQWLEEIQSSLPLLPEERIQGYMAELALPEYDARVIAEDQYTADYFDELISHTHHYKAAANWMLGPVRSWLNENQSDMHAFPLHPVTIAELIDLTDGGKINFSVASSRIFPELIKSPDKTPLDIIQALNLQQDSDTSHIQQIVDQVIAAMPDKVQQYRKGKKGLIGLFVGEVMKCSGGRADPKLANQLLSQLLDEKIQS